MKEPDVVGKATAGERIHDVIKRKSMKLQGNKLLVAATFLFFCQTEATSDDSVTHSGGETTPVGIVSYYLLPKPPVEATENDKREAHFKLWLYQRLAQNHAAFASRHHAHVYLHASSCLNEPDDLNSIQPSPWAKIFLLSACLSRRRDLPLFLWVDADMAFSNFAISIPDWLKTLDHSTARKSIIMAEDAANLPNGHSWQHPQNKSVLFNTGAILVSIANT